MRVYYAEQNLMESDGTPGWLYFRSRVDARKWANSVIKDFVAMNREYDRGFSLSQVGWGAEITVAACDFGTTDKALLVRMLNHEGGFFVRQETVARWTPVDKWKSTLNGGE